MHSPAPKASSAAGWQARLELCLRPLSGRTRLIPQRRLGPLSVQRPFHPEGACCHVYLLHPPGGVVGGDRLNLTVIAERGSEALLTAPGATKFYRSAGDEARVDQHFIVNDGARLEVLPQENIHFPGARLRMRTELELEPGARLLLWEKHCFGRPSIGERFDSGRVDSELRLLRDGQLLFIDRQRIDACEIDRPSGLRGLPVMGSLLLVAPGLDAALIDACRAIPHSNGLGALSRLDDDLLVARWLGGDSAAMNRWFVALWALLRPAALGAEACPPRIWNT